MKTAFVRHQPSGEIYAVEIDSTGDVMRAAGPVPFSRRFSDPADWISNAPNALDDGEWLRYEPISFYDAPGRV